MILLPTHGKIEVVFTSCVHSFDVELSDAQGTLFNLT